MNWVSPALLCPYSARMNQKTFIMVGRVWSSCSWLVTQPNHSSPSANPKPIKTDYIRWFNMYKYKIRCLLSHIITLLYHCYIYFFPLIFPMISPLTIFFLLYHYFNITISIFFLLIVSGVNILIYWSWQMPILVLCAEQWLTSVHGLQWSLMINKWACFIKQSQLFHLNKDYYTHYFLYYTYYFKYLTRIEQLVTSTYVHTAGQHTMNQWEGSCHHIKKKSSPRWHCAKYSKHKNSGFPMGSCDTAAQDGLLGSNVPV